MRVPRLVVIAVLTLAPAGLAGCIHPRTHERLATQAVGFNLTVEEAQNEMLLLNVIRAKDRLPMYLTTLNSLSGKMTATLEGSVGGSYSGLDEETTLTETTGGVVGKITGGMKESITRGLMPSVRGSYSHSPDFTVAILDGQDFTRGFLTPIPQRTFAYFWDQGWPPELLMYLLVSKVEVWDVAGGSRAVYQNYPNSEDPELREMKCYGAWVREFVVREPDLVTSTDIHPIGPPIPVANLQDSAKLIAAMKEGLILERADIIEGDQQDGEAEEQDRQDGEEGGDEPGESWLIQRELRTYQLRYPTLSTQTSALVATHVTERQKACAKEQAEIREAAPADGPEAGAAVQGADPSAGQDSGRRRAGEQVGTEVRYVSLAESAEPTSSEEVTADSGIIKVTGPNGEKVEVILRSPEAIVYYLGQLARVANREDPGPVVPHVCIQGQRQPLFVAVPAGRCTHAYVQARSPWDSYAVPRQREDATVKCDDRGALTVPDVKDFGDPFCEPGRSMQAFRLLGQLISLHKSAAELPVPPLVRVLD